jgi:hypothetical protein
MSRPPIRTLLGDLPTRARARLPLALLLSAASLPGMLFPGKEALACDPVAVASGAPDDPSSIRRARLEARIAELRAEIDALERTLASPDPVRMASPAAVAPRLRIHRIGEPAVGGDGIVVLERGAAPASRGDTAALPTPTRRRVLLSDGRAMAEVPAGEVEGGVVVFRLDGGSAPVVARTRLGSPAPSSCCCCCCSGAGAAGNAPAAAPTARHFRMATPRSAGEPVQLRRFAPVAPSHAAPRWRAASLRSPVPGVPGEMRAIIERSPAVSPCCPGPGSGPPEAPSPPAEHPEPFGGLLGPGRAGAMPVQVRSVNLELAPASATPEAPPPGRQAHPAVRGGGAEYY